MTASGSGSGTGRGVRGAGHGAGAKGGGLGVPSAARMWTGVTVLSGSDGSATVTVATAAAARSVDRGAASLTTRRRGRAIRAAMPTPMSGAARRITERKAAMATSWKTSVREACAVTERALVPSSWVSQGMNQKRPAPAATAPSSWPIQASAADSTGIRRRRSSASVTAGLMCVRDMGPTDTRMPRRTSPPASAAAVTVVPGEVPVMPTLAATAMTAAPTARKTSSAVPIASATRLRRLLIVSFHSVTGRAEGHRPPTGT